MDESRAYYTEWSKSEREKQVSYIKACIWNLERWYDEPTCRAAMETQIQWTDLWTQWGNESEGRIERLTLKWIHYHKENR